MLSFERRVVDAILTRHDGTCRDAVHGWVEGSLADMPEVLRAGVAAESLAFGALARALGRDAGAVLDLLDRSPIGLLRQYPRLFRSLVLFAELELEPCAAA